MKFCELFFSILKQVESVSYNGENLRSAEERGVGIWVPTGNIVLCSNNSNPFEVNFVRRIQIRRKKLNLKYFLRRRRRVSWKTSVRSTPPSSSRSGEWQVHPFRILFSQKKFFLVKPFLYLNRNQIFISPISTFL